MRFISISISILLLTIGLLAPAAADVTQTNSSDLTEMTPVDTQKSISKNMTFGKENSSWNFNLGLSNFENNLNNDIGYKGDGLTIELQRRFADMFYVGVSYTNYKTHYSLFNPDRAYLYEPENSSLDVFTLSLEAHVIQLPLPNHSEFFAAATVGNLFSLPQSEQFPSSSGGNFYYGAGIGINISNQVGVRADVKANRELAAFNSLSLVGYY